MENIVLLSTSLEQQKIFIYLYLLFTYERLFLRNQSNKIPSTVTKATQPIVMINTNIVFDPLVSVVPLSWKIITAAK